MFTLKLSPWRKAILWSVITSVMAIVTIIGCDYLISLSEIERSNFDWYNPTKFFEILLAIFVALWVEQALAKSKGQFVLSSLTIIIVCILFVGMFPHRIHTHMPFEVEGRLGILYDSLITDIDSSYTPTLTQIDANRSIKKQRPLIGKLLTFGIEHQKMWEVERALLREAEYKRKHCPCRGWIMWLIIPAFLVSVGVRKNIYALEAEEVTHELGKAKEITHSTDKATSQPDTKQNRIITHMPPEQVEDNHWEAWCKKFNCTSTELEQAVRRVGRNPQKVEAYLKRPQNPNNNTSNKKNRHKGK